MEPWPSWNQWENFHWLQRGQNFIFSIHLPFSQRNVIFKASLPCFVPIYKGKMSKCTFPLLSGLEPGVILPGKGLPSQDTQGSGFISEGEPAIKRSAPSGFWKPSILQSRTYPSGIKREFCLQLLCVFYSSFVWNNFILRGWGMRVDASRFVAVYARSQARSADPQI